MPRGTTNAAWGSTLHSLATTAEQLHDPGAQARMTQLVHAHSQHTGLELECGAGRHQLGQEAAEDTPHRRLVLLKSAIAQISEEMQKSGMIGEALVPADRIGATIKCLRAVEGRRILAKERALKEGEEHEN